MAYNYTPFDYQRATAAPPLENLTDINQWNQEQNQAQQNAFQDYAGEQFEGLFDIANVNPNPLQGFAQTPTYSPYSGTRGHFTTPVQQLIDSEGYNVGSTGGFDQKGYLDAQFGNINDYLGNLSSFLGNVSGDDASAAVRQGEIQRAMQRASLPQMPTMQPMQQSTYTGGGWGQASPTLQMGNMTQRQQAPAGILGTTNRGMYGGILGGQQGV